MIQPTSASVSLCRSVRYDPYGIQPDRSASLLAFNGEFQDRLTGIYLLGNGRRAYSPALRRFLSADRLSPFSQGGINGYAYCLGDPVNRMDPSGENSVKVIANIVWLGKRAKAHMSNLKGLKKLDNLNKWVKKGGVVLAALGVPGAGCIATASVAVKIGIGMAEVGGFFGFSPVDNYIKHKVMPIIVGILPPKGFIDANKARPVSQASQIRNGHLSRRHSSAF